MGLGDELMAMGEAARTSREFGGARIVIADKFGKPRWHSLWTDAPYMRQPGDMREGITIRNGPGARPYIERHDALRFQWCNYQPVPADLRHIGGWNESTRGAVVIEPNLKRTASPNKQWPLDRWHTLVTEVLPAILPTGMRIIQLGTPALVLPGVEVVPTPDFRSLVQAMRAASLYVGHEGGLHHLSAALGKPAVVIFGGYIWPEHTGYSRHVNIKAGGYACGSRTECAHCRDAMNQITVGMLADAITGALSNAKLERDLPT